VDGTPPAGFPRELTEGERAGDGWSWAYGHSPLCQNTVAVDGRAPGEGWGNNRGYGECITYKGGEEAGAPGADFQVLDVRDHYTWEQVEREVTDFRRTLIGVEGPEGRPYVLDVLSLTGGNDHALFNSAWGERVEAELPAGQSVGPTLADVLSCDDAPQDRTYYKSLAQVRNLTGAPTVASPWAVTWATDYAAYAPRDPDDGSFTRPLPEDVGRVRLRLIGVPQAEGETQLLSGTGPWVCYMPQPLPEGYLVKGNVAFLDARDFVVEHRRAENQPLASLFVHVLEGWREGDEPTLEAVTPLAAVSTKGPERDLVAVDLRFVDGHVDTLIYQSEPGALRPGAPDGIGPEDWRIIHAIEPGLRVNVAGELTLRVTEELP
jgi:hypothetical protein